MCYHKFYIYTTCGHSFFGPEPVVTCRHASISPDSSYSKTCEMDAHPYQSLKLERLCVACQRRRSMLMERLECRQTVRFDEWQWKVSYSAPHEQKSKERKKSEKPSTKSANQSAGGNGDGSRGGDGGGLRPWRKSTK